MASTKIHVSFDIPITVVLGSYSGHISTKVQVGLKHLLCNRIRYMIGFNAINLTDVSFIEMTHYNALKMVSSFQLFVTIRYTSLRILNITFLSVALVQWGIELQNVSK